MAIVIKDGKIILRKEKGEIQGILLDTNEVACCCGCNCVGCFDCCYGSEDTLDLVLTKPPGAYTIDLEDVCPGTPEWCLPSCVKSFPGFSAEAEYQYLGCSVCCIVGGTCLCCLPFCICAHFERVDPPINPDAECDNLPVYVRRCCSTGTWHLVWKPGINLCTLSCGQEYTETNCNPTPPPDTPPGIVCGCECAISPIFGPPVCIEQYQPNGCAGGTFLCRKYLHTDVGPTTNCDCFLPHDNTADITVNVNTCHTEPLHVPSPMIECLPSQYCKCGAGEVPEPPPPDPNNSCPSAICEFPPPFCTEDLLLLVPQFKLFRQTQFGYCNWQVSGEDGIGGSEPIKLWMCRINDPDAAPCARFGDCHQSILYPAVKINDECTDPTAPFFIFVNVVAYYACSGPPYSFKIYLTIQLVADNDINSDPFFEQTILYMTETLAHQNSCYTLGTYNAVPWTVPISWIPELPDPITLILP